MAISSVYHFTLYCSLGNTCRNRRTSRVGNWLARLAFVTLVYDKASGIVHRKSSPCRVLFMVGWLRVF